MMLAMSATGSGIGQEVDDETFDRLFDAVGSFLRKRLLSNPGGVRGLGLGAAAAILETVRETAAMARSVTRYSDHDPSTRPGRV